MEKNTFSSKPDLWGGMECTINRIGDQFLDQLEYSGHYSRHDDFDRFSEMDMKALRFPILWEKHQPEKNIKIDWSWIENQLKKLTRFNIKPIAGLVHHGSGPAFTSLLDSNFPYLLAEYASEVATKFSFIEYYTPVNEPLTTARFSGLYGYWYPHLRDALSFAKIMIN